MNMPMNQKLRKWHFLLLGGVLILLAAFLWYWNWRAIGIPSLLDAEHFIAIFSAVLGLVVLGIFIYRLTRHQVMIMLIGMVIVNLVMAIITLWSLRTYPAIFNLVCPGELADCDPVYIESWRTAFLTPALFVLHIGLLVMWVESLVMFLVRKPTDQPE